MAEEENNKNKSNGTKGLMMVLIALIVILLVAMGFLGYIVYDKVLNPSLKPPQEQAKKAESKDTQQDYYKASINDLILNITNAKGKEKLLKLSFTLKSIEPNIEAIVEEYKPEIIDAVIAKISARSSEELLTVGGKVLLKEELSEDFNNMINKLTSNNEGVTKNNIKSILFTAFVID